MIGNHTTDRCMASHMDYDAISYVGKVKPDHCDLSHKFDKPKCLNSSDES